MVETRVTTMVIKVVDLGCEKCHKKIKKILCQIPQIQSQIYAKEKNTVTITVVCCSPEKIKKKILCKGCGFIECVQIVTPPPPPATPTPPPPPATPTPPPPPPVTPTPPPPPPVTPTPPPPPPVTPTPPPPPPVTPHPPPPPPPHEVNVRIRNTCCNECNEGSCGPWCHCHSMPPPPRWVPYSRPPCVPWENDFCSCRRRGYVVCVCEDHSSPCTIM